MKTREYMKFRMDETTGEFTDNDFLEKIDVLANHEIENVQHVKTGNGNKTVFVSYLVEEDQ